MKLITLKCPNCGGKIEVKDGLDVYFCGYCGSEILLDEQSDAAYKAKAKIKKYEHEEKMRDIKYAQERYKIESERKTQKENDSNFTKFFFIIGGIWLVIAIIFFGGSKIASDKEEKKLESLVEEIQVDIKNEDFDTAYIKAKKIKYTKDWSDEIEDKWDDTREEVINRIIEAEKKATGKSTHEPEKKKGLLNKIFN